MKRFTLLTLAAAVFTFPTGASCQDRGTLPSDLDSFVESVMAEFEVPGVSIAVVKDDRVVLTKGYGVRQLGTNVPVDEHTLFGIASNTKAFTATALGLLVEEGRLDWDAPVIDYLPNFRMSDPFVTREMTIRDLLVHRSGLGLGAGDLMWWPPSDYDRKEIVRRLRYIPLATSFRSAYAYDNVLYSVAGEVIEAVSGQTWEEFVSSRILDPVGMTSSNVMHSAAGFEGDANVATTHARVGGAVRPVAPFLSDNTNPAGGINSNAVDMAKWLRVQLDSGRIGEDRRLFSPGTTVQLWGPVTPIPIGNYAPELASLRPNFLFYALGFGIADYRGHKVVSHTGGLPGYVSRVTMIPDLKLGIAVLTNQESGAAFDAITYRVLDHYLRAPEYDWMGAYAAVMNRVRNNTAFEMGRAFAERDSTAGPSLDRSAYAGTYSDPWYGDIEIAEEGDSLVMRFTHTPSLTGTMSHWQHDTFIVRWWDRELRADAYVTFSIGPRGNIREARMEAVSPATDFSFDFQDLVLAPRDR